MASLSLSTLPCCSSVFILMSLCFILASSKTCKKLDTCSCEMDDGSGIVSLQDVDNKDGLPRKEFKNIPDSSKAASFTFDWNPCTTIKVPDEHVCKGSNLCQKSTSLYGDFPAGGPGTTFSMASDDIVITYSKMTYQKYVRHFILTLSCKKTVPVGSFGLGITESLVTPNEESKYSGTLTSKCACPGVCHYTKNYIPQSSSGLTVGSILLIIFFPLVLLYFVLGIVINKFVRNKEGFPELIPNHSFWADFPFLVKDGCVFSCSKLKYCCSSLYEKATGSSEYAKI